MWCKAGAKVALWVQWGRAMDVHAEHDYKSALKSKIKTLNRGGKPVTLKRLAESIPCQYTYLSRVLKGNDKHLSDDHLFTLCNLLDFAPDEIEYLMLLRASSTTTHESRKHYLQTKLAHLREERKLAASIQEFEGQVVYKDADYLFEPLCVVVHVSLGIEEYRKNPQRLCPALGITRTRLKELLRKLRDVGFIEQESDGSISKVNRAHFHYSPKHPLMRAHQSFLRSLSLSHLSRTEEEDRHSFMVTFSGEPETFREIKEAFQKMIQEMEKKVRASKNTNTYQLTFDLFKWL